MDEHAFDCSTDDDDLIDEEMMFYLEQEVETQLNMHDLPPTSSSHRAFESPTFQRPSNPVAQYLETNEGEPILPNFGASFDTSICDESPSFEYYNGRRKRKYLDDTCCLTPPVRPMAKRVKAFSSDQFPKLPCLDSNNDSSSLPPSPPVTSTPMAIPQRISSLPSLKIERSFTITGEQYSSIPSVSKVLRAASYPTTCLSAPSTSLEVLCRRSLDISSPLRIRFRDLMVSSIGSVSSS